MVAADARTAITFALSPGQASDAVEGRDLLGGIGPLPEPLPLIMDKAYEDNQTLNWPWNSASFRWFRPKAIASTLGNMTKLCTADATKSSDSFGRLKGFRRIFSRFDKLDIVFLAFLNFALIVEALR